MNRYTQNVLLTSSKFEEERNYWLEKLAGDVMMSGFPLYYQRQTLAQYQSAALNLTFPAEVSQKILAISNRSLLGVYVFLLSGVKYLIYRYTHHGDIVVGMPPFEQDIDDYNEYSILRTVVNHYETFRELLLSVKNTVNDARRYRNLSFTAIAELIGFPIHDESFPTFNTIVLLENIHSQDNLKQMKADLSLSFKVDENADTISLRLQYAANLYDEITLEQIANHLINFFQTVIYEPNKKLADIEFLTPEERRQILEVYNGTDVTFPKNKTLQKLFTEAQNKYPERIAVRLGDSTLTYRELHERSNQIAHYLMKQGIGRNDFIGVLAYRYPDSIANIMGILKAGAAYVPIEPEYPQDRREYILTNSNCKLVLEPDSYRTLNISEYPAADIKGKNYSEDIAYVIYTSGSTGKPKGVVITQQAVVNTILDINQKYGIGPEDRIIGLSSMCFDLSVYDIFGALSTGATLVMIPDQRDMENVARVINKYQITVWNSVPAIMDILTGSLPQDFVNTGLRLVMLSGDWIPLKLPAAIAEHFPQAAVISLGGATEGSIWSIYYPVTEVKAEWTSIPYGMPLANQKFFVLDPNRQLCPVGVEGELFIGGAGVASGYLNDFEKTSQAFMQHPSLGYIYRTGDYGKFHREGYIEFLGRKDQQIKIRGYRVELGEIESCLHKFPGINNVVVVDRQDQSGKKYLCAYYTANREILASELRDCLGKDLPEYMIPSYFVKLTAIPLTPNGKIDKKALPEPAVDTREYVAPRNEIEAKLVKTVQDVLKLDSVSITDNFFELGGDSIVAMQIAALLRNYRLKIEINDLFQFPVLGDLSAQIKQAEFISQEMVTGEVEITPIQRWFFLQNFTAMDQWNHSVTLFSKSRLDEAILRKTLETLVEHHDALRMVFHHNNGQVTQSNREMHPDVLHMTVYNLTASPDYEPEITRQLQTLHQGIRLEGGPLVNAGLFLTPQGNRFVIVIHHLVVDGVSWRIILDDFITLYTGFIQGLQPELPEKTDSFKDWSRKLRIYAEDERLLNELDYWKAIEEAEITPLPKDYPVENNLVKDSRHLNLGFSREETDQLLKSTVKAFNTGVNDLILAAMGMAIHQWSGRCKILANLEGHGRENIIENINVTRTVGWFTSMYPFMIEIDSHLKTAEQAQAIIAGLRNIPNKGIGYGILRYVTPEHLKAGVAFRLKPEISFNYLGQVDQSPANEELGVTCTANGLAADPLAERLFILEVNSLISNGELTITFEYNQSIHRETTIMELSGYFRKNLLEIMDRASSILPVLESSAGEQISVQRQPDDSLYQPFPLTDVQSAYFIGRSENFEMGGVSSHHYIEFETKVPPELLATAFQKIVDRHPMLRAIVLPSGEQQFLKEVPPFQVEINDISHLDKDIQSLRIQDERDNMSHHIFQLDQWPIIELKVYRLAKDCSYVFISYDLIIMDGASLQIVFNEISSLVSDPNRSLPELHYTFRDYVLAYRELKKSEAYQADKEYWLNKLDEFPPAPALPYIKDPASIAKPRFSRKINLLGREEWERLKKLAQRNSVTPSMLLCAIYADVLAFWSNQPHLAINLTVFNRVPLHPDVNRIVGDFTSIVILDLDLSKHHSFWAKARYVQSVLMKDLEHRLFDGVEFVRELATRNADRTKAIMPVVFTSALFGEMDETSYNDQELGIERMGSGQTPQVFLDFQATENNRKLMVKWDYVAELFDPEVIEMMFDQFNNTLTSLLQEPEAGFRLSPAVKDIRMIEQYNGTDQEIPPTTLQQLIAAQVKRTPEGRAVIFEDDSITFRELDEKSNQVAHYLREKGIRTGDFVCVLAKRCIPTIVNILGILKVGAAYVPVDPEYPSERKSYIFDNSQCKLMLEPDLYLQENLGRHPIGNMDIIIDPESIAYVIYTSGSTGQPKGVVITHRAVSNTIIDINQRFQVNEQDRIIGLSSMCFDLSVYDIFGALSTGATLVMVRDQRDVKEIMGLIHKHRITIWNSVPAIMDMLIEASRSRSKAALTEITVNQNEPPTDLVDSMTHWQSVWDSAIAFSDMILDENPGSKLAVPGVQSFPETGEEKDAVTYYWSPVIHWERDGEVIHIDQQSYRGLAVEIFPEFYFVAQKGVRIDELIGKFPAVNREKLTGFIHELIEQRILITSILAPHEVFKTQDRLFTHHYGNELNFNPQAYHDYKVKQLNRTFENCTASAIPLAPTRQYPSFIEERRSYRAFEEKTKVPGEVFSQLLSVFRQTRKGDEAYYYYACAGGLYPLDVFIHVKENRVENIKAGLYYYNPLHNHLSLITDQANFSDDFHFYTNKPIFKSSAFSVYIVYNAEVTMPKYGSAGYLYACIDTGIMVGTLTAVAEMLGVGLCSIGDIDFAKIKDHFKLNQNQVLIHTIEAGLKPDLALETETRFKWFPRDSAQNMAFQPQVAASEADFHQNPNTSLRLVMLSGDWIPIQLPHKIKECFKKAEVYSLGGATEASIWSIYYPINFIGENWKSIPYGMPLANQKFYVLNYELGFCPVGVPGELYIGGVGVAAGYLNDEEKTKAAFISHPQLGYIYRTGDYGVLHREGYIEFLGRKDQQVKIRGFRIELAEIESSLLKYDGIRNVLVIDYQDESNKKYLCAYLVSSQKLMVSELREFLRRRLPDYMIPTFFMQLDNIPLTANGKVDRKGLPKPELQADTGINYVAPRNELEEQLAKMWRAALNLDKIGVYDNFFELGGDSLKAATLILQTNDFFQVQIPLTEIFRNATIDEVSKYIFQIKDQNDREDQTRFDSATREVLVSLKQNASPGNLFFIHAGSGEIDGYMHLSNYLAADSNLWGIRSERFADHCPQSLTIEDIARKYVQKIRQVQPQGPYRIAGWCIGGTISYEIVRQLELMNETVAFFGLINSLAPQPVTDVVDFSLEAEKKMVKEFLRAADANEVESVILQIDQINHMAKLWSLVVDSLVTLNIDPNQIKKSIPEGIAVTIPNFDQLNTKELLYYFNVVRSYIYARSQYIPAGKIHTQVHFFEADRARIKSKNLWDSFCVKPIQYLEITGDHFSIFKNPEVVSFAQFFDQVLTKTDLGEGC
ncbi:MAG TPA: amino acid adenylation domain-containing protein [Bacillota bacterium]|nr:amino acid adenylation domain-containing protein [Bacillota bacterium]